MLHVDENEAISISGFPKKKFIRTGTVAKGSCFFHALFTSLDPITFKFLSPEEREEYVIEQREEIAESLSYEEWSSLHIMDAGMQVCIANYLKAIYKGRIKTEGVEELLELYETYKELEQDITSSNDRNLFNIKEGLTIERYTEKVKKLTPHKVIHKLFLHIFNRCETRLFEKYKENLADPNFFIEQQFIHFLSKKYKVNIIFITEDGEPYRTGRDDCQDMKRNNFSFVLLYWHNEIHFESIACAIEDMSTYRRVFEGSDPIIKVLLKKMCEI